MKVMTCRQLGGACDKEFRAASFEEMASLSQNHAKQMFSEQDEAHVEAMEKMQHLMQDSEALEEWMQEKIALYNSLPEE